MGQAKQRGTTEQRVAAAQERNIQFAANLPKGHALQKNLREMGAQRLVTRLVMAGYATVQPK